MARSSIQGIEPATPEPAGRDTASLGPGDTSDSGSDMMGIDDIDGGDPNAPTDVASRDENGAALLSPEALDSPSVAGGTGESRSAAGDGGRQDGWDIGVDRVFTPEASDTDAATEEDPDLASLDDAEAGDPLDDEENEREEGDATPPTPRP
jgi:hypothetical protein